MSKILIVDDDHDFAESIADLLEIKGYGVELAFSGESAIEMLQGRDFDLILMDVMLPGKNGVDCYLEMQKLSPSVRVVIMTGYSVVDLLDRALEHGVWSVLQKPLDTSQLLALVERSATRGHILVTDDDPDFVESLRTLLQNRGFAVAVASDGREAIDAVLKGGVDVMLLDLRMPVLGGPEVYEELSVNGRMVPTIVVTAYADEEAAWLERIRATSAIECLSKPIDPDRIESAISRLIEASGPAQARSC